MDYNQQFEEYISQYNTNKWEDIDYISRQLWIYLKDNIPQLNYNTTITPANIHELYYCGNYAAPSPDNPVLLPMQYAYRKPPVRIGYKAYYFVITLDVLYDAVEDILYVSEPYIYDTSYMRPPRKKFILAQVCPRCGSLDFSVYGSSLPKWLRVKSYVTCKECGHTAHQKEFKA